MLLILAAAIGVQGGERQQEEYERGAGGTWGRDMWHVLAAARGVCDNINAARGVAI